MMQHKTQAYLTGGPVFLIDMNTQADRVMELLKSSGLTDRQIKPALAKACGITYQSVREWFTGDSKTISAENLAKIAETFNGSLEYLASGKGELKTRGGLTLHRIQSWDSQTPLDDDEVEVPLYKEVTLAAGAGATHSIEINGPKLRFSKATMRSAGVMEENAACATVSGNSMERLIMDGSTVGIDRGRTQIRDGEIYAIDHDGMLRVKYLYRLPGGGLRIRSENREEYPDENLTADEAVRVRILGWVFWWSTVRRWR